MKKKTGGGSGSDSTAYHKKKIEGSNKIIQAKPSEPIASYAGKSLSEGAKGLSRAENKKAGVPNPAPAKKDFSKGSPYNTKKSSLNTGQGMTIKRSTQPIIKAIKGATAEGAAEAMQTVYGNKATKKRY